MSTPVEGGAGPAKSSSGFADLGPRLASAVVLVAAALITLYVGGDLFALFWMTAGLAINWEWQGLVGGPRRVGRVVAGGAAVAAAAAFGRNGMVGMAALEIALFALVAAILAGQGRRIWAGAGVVYAGALVFSVCLLRESFDFGALAIAFLFAAVWGTDIFAYFGGRFIGGPRLWARVSAGKTWSGTIVGVISGGLLGLAAAYFGGGPALASWQTFIVGLCTAVVSQTGDLFESAVKRRHGVKDSSQLIPGHGGVMDRLDGFIFASAFTAALGLVRGDPSVAAGLFFW